MKKSSILLLSLGILAFSASALAQTPTFHLGWNQPDAAPTAITTGGYQYTLKIDTGTPTILSPTCVAAVAPATGSNCTVPLMTVSGSHTLVLTVYNGFGSTSAPPLMGTTPATPIGVSVTITLTIP